MDARVVAVAPNGARRTRTDHPALPLGPAETARDAVACAAAGARVLHLHVRDAAGAHTIDAQAYAPAIAAVHAATGDGLIVQITTEAVGRYTREAQMATVRAVHPQAASMAVSELVPDAEAENEAAAFLAWAAGVRIGLQFIVYSAADAVRLVDLTERGIVPSHPRHPPHALFVLGRYSTGQRADPHDLLPFLAAWPDGWPWTVCAFGPLEAACLAEAIAHGGHVRVGFENNLLRPDGTPAANNAEQVARIGVLAGRAGRPLATTAEARALYCPGA